MSELVYEISEQNPTDFFGINNTNINVLTDFFPKLKLIARGNKLTVMGQEEELAIFNQKYNQLLQYYLKYQVVNQNIIQRIVQTTDPEFSQALTHGAQKILLHGVAGKVIKAQTENQQRLIASVAQNDMVFAVGPAGTGKTYTSIALAVKALKEKKVKQIILTRPAVEAGENLGFLPGDLKEKLDPYMQPLYDALRDMMPHQTLLSHLEKNIIQIAPLAFMRGRTLDHCFVILDEAQNTTPAQMKMFLTRMGKDAKFLITADPDQIDLPKRQPSGLLEALSILANIKGIEIITLTEKDVIRHPLVKDIILAYKKRDNLKTP